MMRLFHIAAERHEEITKAAGLPGMLLSAGRYAVKNPLKTLGGVLTAQQVGSDANKMVGMAGRGMSRAPNLTSTF